MDSTKRIAIIGAGLAGVSLALSLLERGISCIIYEKETDLLHHLPGLAVPSLACPAMKECSSAIVSAHAQTANETLLAHKDGVFIEVIDSHVKPIGTMAGPTTKPCMSISLPDTFEGCIRTRFLHVMADHLPEGTVVYRKHLREVVRAPSGDKLVLEFDDGSYDVADVVVGCDGMWSTVRGQIVGRDHSSAKPGHSTLAAYSTLVDIGTAKTALGSELALSAYCHMNWKRSIFTMPVAQGQLLSISAVLRNMQLWARYSGAVEIDKSEGFTLFEASWSAPIRKLIEQTDRWTRCAVFDLADDPPERVVRGRVCIIGDAAHGMTPFLGISAAVTFEDVLVLAELLADERVSGSETSMKAALAAYAKVRQERGRWATDASRRFGELMMCNVGSADPDFRKIQAEVDDLVHEFISWQPTAAVAEAKAELENFLEL